MTNVAAEKYSVLECERRFLLENLPAEASEPRFITDLYIHRSRLRLRLVKKTNGEVLQRKLGHKRRVAEGDPSVVIHTSLYLNEKEYEILSALPGRELTKTRWTIQLVDRKGAVDVFEGNLAGLMMLEVDLADPDRALSYRPPHWAGKEVTHDDSFSGHSLAEASF